MIREEDIQKAKDATFPIPEGGRSYEQSLAASGFELGARWASALNEPNISFKELMIRSCIEIALTDVIEKRFSDYGTSLKECLEWIEEQQNKIAFYEKQGKQKPFDYEHATITQKDFAPKQEPKFKIGDVLCDKSCITLDKNSQPNIEILDIRNGLYICNNCTFPISQQDEYELVAKKIEQNPADNVEQKQEWSEEDEKKRNLLINILKVNHPNGYFKANPANTLNMEAIHTEELVSWLKSLKDRVRGKED